MWLFRRQFRSLAPAERFERRTPSECAGCKRRADRYVYMENHKDYCIPCARGVLKHLGIRPAGKRRDDVTNLDDL